MAAVMKTNNSPNGNRVGRRTFLAAGASAALSPALRGMAGGAGRANIILTMTDDQGWGDTSYNGHRVLRTPNLDRMAAGGIRFDRFYAAAPVCSPTRASVMTGRHPSRYRCFSWGYDLPLREVTVAEAAKRAGYVTGHFGKWHLGGLPVDFTPGGNNRANIEEPPGPPEKTARHPGNQGFDEWFSAGNWFDLDYPHMYHNGQPAGPMKGAPADFVMDHALEWIAQAVRRKQPFLAVIWFPEPHGPHIALDKDKGLYSTLPPEDANYFGEMNAVDRNIGRLRAELRRLGIQQNTMLWFNSDNGAIREDSASGLSGGKGNLMEGGIRVPGILEWPARIGKPFATSVPVCTVDIYPTILDLLEVRMPNQIEPIDGISLLPLIAGRMPRRPKPLCFNWLPGFQGRSAAAIIDNEYKYFRGQRIQGFRGKPAPEGEYLFDVAADRAENYDMLKAKPEVAARLRDLLAVWEKSVEKDMAAYPPARSDR